MNNPAPLLLLAFWLFGLSLPAVAQPSLPLPAPEWFAPAQAPDAPGDTVAPVFTLAAPAAQAPVISEIVATIRADESFTLTGKDFTLRFGDAAGTDTVVWLWASDPSGGTLHQCRIWSITPDVLIAATPPGIPDGLYLVWVENEVGIGHPLAINRATARWAGPLGARVPAGQAASLTIYGANLSRELGRDTAYAYLQPAAGGAWTPLAITDVHPHAVTVATPANLAAGDYLLHLHNGHGGAWGWSEPLPFSAITPWVRDSFEVVAPAPSGGDDAPALRAAIAQVASRANGGTVRLPAGTYRLESSAGIPGTGWNTPVLVPSHVRLVGAGKDETRLRVMITGFNPSFGLRVEGTHAALADLTVVESSTPGFCYYGILDAEGTDLDFLRVGVEYEIQPTRTTAFGAPVTRFSGSRISIVECTFMTEARISGRDHFVHQNLGLGGPYGGEWIGETQVNGAEAPFGLYGFNHVITKNRVETLDWPDLDGNRQYLDLIPAAELQWRPWAKRFFHTGGSNRNWHVAGNIGVDLGFDGNKGEMMLFHGVPHGFIAQVASATANTLTMRTDGTLDGRSDLLIDRKAPARSLADLTNPDVAGELVNPDGWLHAIIIAGTGIGQSRLITAHTSHTLTLDHPWRVPPATDSIFVIQQSNQHIVITDNDLSGFPDGYRNLGQSASTLVSLDGNASYFHINNNRGRGTFSGIDVLGGPTSTSNWNQIRDNQVEDVFTDTYAFGAWQYDSENSHGVGTLLIGNTIHGGHGSTQTARQGEGSSGQSLISIFSGPTPIPALRPMPPIQGAVIENLTGSGMSVGADLGQFSAGVLRGNTATLAHRTGGPTTGISIDGPAPEIDLIDNTFHGATRPVRWDSGNTTATASQPGNPPNNATDGNPGTLWTGPSNNENHWLRVDLGSAREIDRVAITWGWFDFRRHRIETSLDGTTWDIAVDASDGVSAAATNHTFAPRTTRYVRLFLLPSGWPSVAEFEIRLGAAGPNLAIPALYASVRPVLPSLRATAAGPRLVPIANLGIGPATWQVVETDAPWLQAQAPADSALPAQSPGSEAAALALAIDPAGLADGAYWGTVVLASSDGQTQRVGVRLDVGDSVTPPPTDPVAATPVISPAPGAYASPVTVTATTSTPGATLRHTTDGTDPIASSPVLPTGGLTLSASTTVKVRAFAAGFTSSPVATAAYTIATAPPPGATPHSLFDPTLAVPASTDPTAYELGVRLTAATEGWITAIRFYKVPGETGPHTGHVWSATGALLASAAFTSETASGWQQVELPAPLAIGAGQTFVASVNTNADVGYAYQLSGFAAPITNGPLNAAIGAGVFNTTPGAFPAASFQNSNYYRDVVFKTPAEAPAPGTLAAWRIQHFNEAQLADALISGPAATPAGDGLPNLLKYHLGLDPWQPAPPEALPFISLNTPAADVLTLAYWKDRYTSDAQGVVEWSETLAPDSWSAEGVTVEVVEQTDTREHIEAHVPVADRPRLFMRLRVTPTP